MKFKENSNRKFYNFETMFKSLKKLKAQIKKQIKTV